jgi:ribosomal protein L44E
MSGVYDKAEMYCPRCKRRTMHEIGWESEEPDSLEETCLSCNRHEISTSHDLKEGAR